MKLTRAEWKAHEKALSILKEPKLNSEEKEFVFRNYHPGANHNITKGAIFFTPWEYARSMAMWHGDCELRDIIEPTAGIGILAYHLLPYCEGGKITCIEMNPEFVEIGKKLVPEATWIRGNAFDVLPTLGVFHSAIANPPYGNIPTNQSTNFRGHIQFGIMELLLRHTKAGATVLIPDCDHSQENKGRDRPEKSRTYQKFRELYPQAHIVPCAVDMNFETDEPDPYLTRFRNTNIRTQICSLDLDGGSNPYLIKPKPQQSTQLTLALDRLRAA